MEKILLEDLYRYKFLSAIAYSPKGKNLGFLVKSADVDNNKYHSDLYVAEGEGEPRPYTSQHDVKTFLWLSDEELLFTADRDPEVKKKVENGEAWTVFYKLSLGGGEAAEFMRLPLSVAQMRPLPGGRFAVLAEWDPALEGMESDTKEEKEARLKKVKEEKDYEVLTEIPFWSNGKGFIRGKRKRLYICTPGEKGKDPSLKTVSAKDEEAALRDVRGDKVLYTRKTMRGVESMKSALCEYDVSTGKSKVLVPEREYNIQNAGYLGDEIFALATDQKIFGMNQNPLLYKLSKNGLVPWLEEDISYGGSVGSDCRMGGGTSMKASGDALYFIATTAYTTTLYRLSKDGKLTAAFAPQGTVDSFDVAGGKLSLIAMVGDRLQEVYALRKGKAQRRTRLNEEVTQGKAVSTPSHFTFKNEGVELDGWVMKPFGYQKGKKYPGILNIHGGPKTAYGAVFFHEMQLWAAEGYFVFFCNPRGGDGKGNVFADLRGKYGTIDYDDLMLFTDLVLKRYPDIDPAHLGVTGGSYGGFMTNWIIGHTHRFAAAATQRSISNWTVMGYTCDIGYFFVDDQVAATPWSDQAAVWNMSPYEILRQGQNPHAGDSLRPGLPLLAAGGPAAFHRAEAVWR